ncbi:phosphoadenosine phosphosulfate reductase [Roseovarius sp. CAU 1744]|uniref:phosphoadenosine phosphosulfate reductase n=1 Tax=Roseovarius sp. CAU 1744 TaxID=3140368 RepID=UPI00325B9283
MKDMPDGYETPLKGLAWTDWLEKLTAITDEDGYVERLGDRHAAILVEEKPTLLVTFETHQGIDALSDLCHPMGWEMVKALGWSHLCLVSEGDTWFRDRHVYAYFDRLVDDGFLEDFEQVIFYGAGACGYAAAAFSVAAPGAQVLLLQPQASLDPDVAEWDRRFRHMRRVSFTDRYGYAPDMLEAADQAFVLYDPEIREDAMHAALFNRPNVTRFRMRHLGREMERSLVRMNILLRAIAQLSAGKLNRHRLARLFRSRRDDASYQFSLLKRLTTDNRPYLVMLLAGKVLEKREAPPFRKAFARARSRLGIYNR